MINLSNKYSIGFFLILFFKDNFFVYDPKVEIKDEKDNLYNFEGQECIKDKNGKLYPIWRFDSNTSKEKIEEFLYRFSFKERTEEEEKIIEGLIKKNILEISGNFVYGEGVKYGKNLLFYFLNNPDYYIDENVIVVEYINEFNISYIAGLIFFTRENKLPIELKKIKNNKEYIFQIDSLSICSLLQKNGLGSELLKKLNFSSNSIIYLNSGPQAFGFYKKNGFKKIDNTNYFYKIYESKSNFSILNIYGIPYDLIEKFQPQKLVLEFSGIEDKNKKLGLN